MDIYSGHMNKLIEQLSRLPGVGAKSAQRLAFHIINMPKEEVEGLASAMTDAKAHIKYCKECFTLTDDEICPICANEKRDHSTIMVVEQTRDMAAYERPESMRVSIMYCTVQSARCLASVRPTLS